MPDQDDIEAQQRLLRAHRRTLFKLLEQRALLGVGHAPPGLLNGIEEAQEQIAQAKDILRA